jgi:hypothetical protein
MAHEKRLDEDAYNKLLNSVPDFLTRYKIISDNHQTEKKFSKEQRKKWGQLCVAQRPKGIRPDDWMALIAEYQVKTGIVPKKEQGVVEKVKAEVEKTVRFFRNKVQPQKPPHTEQLQFFP